MKTYVLTVSRVFPKTHARSGEPTNFREKILKGCNQLVDVPGDIYIDLDPKIHTIRANYHLWKKRIDEVNAGEAILSVRYWSGKPYNSKQLRIAEFDKDSGIGVQKLCFYDDGDGHYSFENPYTADSFDVDISEVAENDGLSFEDFKEWFRKYDLSKPMAIIHFTKFRY